jgi:hypothetical protein
MASSTAIGSRSIAATGFPSQAAAWLAQALRLRAARATVEERLQRNGGERLAERRLTPRAARACLRKGPPSPPTTSIKATFSYLLNNRVKENALSPRPPPISGRSTPDLPIVA